MNGLILILVILAWLAIGLAAWDIWRIKTGRKYGFKK